MKSNGYRRIEIGLIYLLAGLLATAATCRGAGVLGPGWPYRRALMVAARPENAPGKSMAWASFYTNSKRLPNGSDLRITTAGGLVMPMKLLQISPNNDLVTVAFEAPSSGTYYACWGNPHPGAPPPPLKIDRGVYLRAYRFAPGGNGSPRGMLRALEHGQVAGRLIVPNIFLGYDPLGFARHAMFLYTGYLHIVRPGKYTFGFDVASKGFLDLDGDMLLTKRYPGGMWGRVRFHRTVRLRPGWHKLIVGQISYGNRMGVAVDWITPGRRQYQPVPPSAFAMAPQATPGRLTKIGDGYQADFNIQPEAQIFVPSDHYFQRWAFEVDVPASFAPAVKWKFSDGQTALGLRVDHDFLTPGNYTITAVIREGTHRFSATRRITVRTEMYSQFPYPPTDPAINVARLINGYQLDKLSGEQLYRGVRFFEHYSAYAGLTHWGIAWALSPDKQPDKQVLKMAVRLGRRLELKKQFTQAANLYLLVARKQISAWAKATLMAHYALTEGDFGKDSARALAVTSHWIRHQPGMPAAARRMAEVAECYAAIAAGNGPLATKLAQAATPPHINFKSAELRQGEWARDVESYIGSGHFDTARNLLNQWDCQFPLEMIRGFTRMERMKLMVAMGYPTVAAKMGMAFAAACPGSFYAAEILYRSAQNFKAGGHRTMAMLAMAKIKKAYPESPYAYKH